MCHNYKWVTHCSVAGRTRLCLFYKYTTTPLKAPPSYSATTSLIVIIIHTTLLHTGWFFVRYSTNRRRRPSNIIQPVETRLTSHQDSTGDDDPMKYKQPLLRNQLMITSTVIWHNNIVIYVGLSAPLQPNNQSNEWRWGRGSLP